MSAVSPPLPVSREDLIDFVYCEAELLDLCQYQRWLDLFADDGRYWIAAQPGQTDARLQGSLMLEDKVLLRARIERLSGERTFSQQPESRGMHVLQRPTVTTMNQERGEFTLRTRYLYVETRATLQHTFACTARHTLACSGGALKIVEKRIDLLNCDAPLPMIQLFM